MERIYYFVLGAILAFVGFVIIDKTMATNISDAELYRFCMVKGIKLEACKIPPMPLEKQV